MCSRKYEREGKVVQDHVICSCGLDFWVYVRRAKWSRYIAEAQRRGTGLSGRSAEAYTGSVLIRLARKKKKMSQGDLMDVMDTDRKPYQDTRTVTAK